MAWCRKWRRAGNVHDRIRDGDTEQNHDDYIADAANSTTATNVIPRKGRKNARRMRRPQHRLPVLAVRTSRRRLKPDGPKKVASDLTNKRRKTAVRRRVRRNRQNFRHNSHLQ